MDPATAATATTDLLNDRTARLRLLVDEAEHQLGHTEADGQNAQDIRAQVSEWHERCRVEMPEIQALTRRRGHRDLRTYLEPPQGLEAAIRHLIGGEIGGGRRRWLSLLWLTDIRGILPTEAEMGTLRPQEAMAVTAELLKNANKAMAQAVSRPETDFIMWLPRETNLATRLLAHIQTILTQNSPDRRFVLVCERPPTPAYCSAEATLDFWKSHSNRTSGPTSSGTSRTSGSPSTLRPRQGARYSKRCGVSP